MKAAFIVELKPFVVPNYVDTTDKQLNGFPRSIPLRDLDERTLNRMCDEFRKSVFEKAGIEQKGEGNEIN